VTLVTHAVPQLVSLPRETTAQSVLEAFAASRKQDAITEETIRGLILWINVRPLYFNLFVTEERKISFD
jgi:hypothetical protein